MFIQPVNHALDATALAGWIFWLLEPPARAGAADDTSVDEDSAVFLRAAGGDQLAWQALFDRWKKPLLAFFYRSLGSMAESEDLTLEVFVRLHRAAPRYEQRAQFATFLFHIARNLLLNEQRRRRRKPVETVSPEAFEYLPAGGEDESRRLAELEETFQRALAQLPEAQRTVLLLVQQQGLDHHSAAAVLAITENALRVQLHRARERLKEIMSAIR